MKYKNIVDDLHAYICISMEVGIKKNEILYNVLHDLSGTVKKLPGFSPRTSGYAEILKKEKEK